MEGTAGTETSQYPQEEKLNEDSQAVASERDIGQTVRCASAGVVGTIHCGLKTVEAELAWKGRPKKVKVPYANLR